MKILNRNRGKYLAVSILLEIWIPQTSFQFASLENSYLSIT
jgi:hypothetical protein